MYWCTQPGQCIQTRFEGDWVLPLLGDAGQAAWRRDENACDVVVRGLCPFQVDATTRDGALTFCDSIGTHMHQADDGAGPLAGVVTPKSPVLPLPLVTQTMPLSALLRSAGLRRVSLYFFRDRDWPAGVARERANESVTVPRNYVLPPPGINDCYPNPACRRMLQRLADERRWRLDETPHFSIDSWTNIIGNDNIVLFARGNRVPCPPAAEYKASLDVYRVAIGFWTPFQQRMWEDFLDDAAAPACYLDAVNRCDRDGFQLWTLLYERRRQPVPLAHLVTTAVTVGLVADWLSAIVDHSQQPLPRKTIFVNSMRAVDALEAVFTTWDVRYCRYYIDQLLKCALHKGPQVVPDARVARAIQAIDADFDAAIEAVRTAPAPALRASAEFLLGSAAALWMPRSPRERALFDRSARAVANWRYLLWATMLARPATDRIDSVLHFLVRVLVPGVEAAVRALDAARSSNAAAAADLCAAHMELGSGDLTPALQDIAIRRAGDSLVHLAAGHADHVIDREYNVCFCDAFVRQGLCCHLIYWSTRAIHQPGMARHLDTMPRA